MSDDILNSERSFELSYNLYKNGNISHFKKILTNSEGDEILNFIKWLQVEGLKL